jgi:opacity protein-like surface antigen
LPSAPILRFLFLVGLALSAFSAARAQVAPSVVGSETHLWAGAEYSRFLSDYHVSPLTPGAAGNGNYQLKGVTFFANLGIHGRFSLEGEARLLTFDKPFGETEKAFLIGPSARLYRRGRLSLNAKFLGGAGLINFPFDLGYGSYFAFAPAGNVEYRLTRHFKARAEYEYVFQPSAPGLPNQPSNGVNPHGFNVGIAYRIF